MNITCTNFICQLPDKNEIDIYKSCVHIYTTSKQIELEGLGSSPLEAILKSIKILATGTFKLNLLKSYV